MGLFAARESVESGHAAVRQCSPGLLRSLASPHLYSTRHKLSDFDVLILPSRIRFRLATHEKIFEGPGFSSIHQGTEQLLSPNYKTTKQLPFRCRFESFENQHQL